MLAELTTQHINNAQLVIGTLISDTFAQKAGWGECDIEDLTIRIEIENNAIIYRFTDGHEFYSTNDYISAINTLVIALHVNVAHTQPRNIAPTRNYAEYASL